MGRHPIEVSVGGLNELRVLRKLAICAVGFGAKTVESGQRARRGDLENRAQIVGPAEFGQAVEVPIRGLDQSSGWLRPVGAVKPVQRRQLALGRDLENRAVAVGPANLSCPVEVSVGALNQSCVWNLAVGAARLGAKAVKRGQLACWSDFKNRASGGPTVAVG